MKKQALLFLLTFCLVTPLLAQQPAPVGLQLYTFRHAFAKDVPGTFAKIKEMGFREIEGGGTYNLSHDEFMGLLQQNGLKMVSMGASFDDLQKDPAKVVEKAKAFGAEYVTCTWIPHDGDNFTFDDAKKAVQVFNTAGKVLADNGLKLVYHNHGYEFRPRPDGGSGTMFDYMAQNLDPRYCNFEMDVYWTKYPGQDPVALLKKYPNRFLLMHLKDRKPGTPGNQNGRTDVETNVVLGQGDLDIAAIMKQAKKSGVKHYFIEDESSRSMEQVPQSLAFLRTVM